MAYNFRHMSHFQLIIGLHDRSAISHMMPTSNKFNYFSPCCRVKALYSCSLQSCCTFLGSCPVSLTQSLCELLCFVQMRKRYPQNNYIFAFGKKLESNFLTGNWSQLFVQNIYIKTYYKLMFEKYGCSKQHLCK